MKTHSILKKIIRMAYGATAVNMQISQLTDEISQLQERLVSKKQQLVELEDARSRYVDQVRRDYSSYYQYDASDDDYSSDDSDESDYGVPCGYSSDDVWQCPTCRTCIRAYCHCNDPYYDDLYWLGYSTVASPADDDDEPDLNFKDSKAIKVDKDKRSQAQRFARAKARKAVGIPKTHGLQRARKISTGELKKRRRMETQRDARDALRE